MKNNITKVIVVLMLTISVASINYTLKSQDITTHDTQKKIQQDIQKLITTLGNVKIARQGKQPLKTLAKITELIDKQSNESLKEFQASLETPLLQFAIAYNYIPLIEKLINKGSNLDQKKQDFFSPLAQASYNSSPLEIVKMLIAAGADSNTAHTNPQMSSAEEMKLALSAVEQLANDNPLKQKRIELYNIFNTLQILSDSFDNNISFNTIKESINPNYIGLFIMNRVNQNPSELTMLKDYFHSIDILDSIKDYIQFANSEALKVIQQAINKENQIKKLANQQDKKQLTDIEILTQN